MCFSPPPPPAEIHLRNENLSGIGRCLSYRLSGKRPQGFEPQQAHLSPFSPHPSHRIEAWPGCKAIGNHQCLRILGEIGFGLNDVLPVLQDLSADPSDQDFVGLGSSVCRNPKASWVEPVTASRSPSPKAGMGGTHRPLPCQRRTPFLFLPVPDLQLRIDPDRLPQMGCRLLSHDEGRNPVAFTEVEGPERQLVHLLHRPG